MDGLNTANTVGYCRTSTKVQEIDNQVQELKKLGITTFFCDSGISGTTIARNRPDFKNMMEYVKENNIKYIYVYELSRIGRSMEDVIDTFLWLEKQDVHVFSIQESFLNINNNEIRKLFCFLFSWVYSQELKNLSERVKVGIEHSRTLGNSAKKRNGRWGTEPKKVSEDTYRLMKEKGYDDTKCAAEMNVSIQTLNRRKRAWKLATLGR